MTFPQEQSNKPDSDSNDPAALDQDNESTFSEAEQETPSKVLERAPRFVYEVTGGAAGLAIGLLASAATPEHFPSEQLTAMLLASAYLGAFSLHHKNLKAARADLKVMRDLTSYAFVKPSLDQLHAIDDLRSASFTAYLLAYVLFTILLDDPRYLQIVAGAAAGGETMEMFKTRRWVNQSSIVNEAIRQKLVGQTQSSNSAG